MKAVPSIIELTEGLWKNLIPSLLIFLGTLFSLGASAGEDIYTWEIRNDGKLQLHYTEWEGSWTPWSYIDGACLTYKSMNDFTISDCATTPSRFDLSQGKVKLTTPVWAGSSRFWSMLGNACLTYKGSGVYGIVDCDSDAGNWVFRANGQLAWSSNPWNLDGGACYVYKGSGKLGFRSCMEDNLALGARVSQSSTYHDNSSAWGASKAVDGRADDNTFSHTKYHNTSTNNSRYATGDAWLELALESVARVNSIHINNREGSAYRLANFYVFTSTSSMRNGASIEELLSTPGIAAYYHEGQAPDVLNLTEDLVAKYVRIQLDPSNKDSSNSRLLHIDEIEVYGTELDLAQERADKDGKISLIPRTIKTADGSQCLASPADIPVDELVVKLVDCSGSVREQWYFTKDQGIRNATGIDFCLTRNGSELRLRKCSDSFDDQDFNVTYDQIKRRVAGYPHCIQGDRLLRCIEGRSSQTLSLFEDFGQIRSLNDTDICLSTSGDLTATCSDSNAMQYWSLTDGNLRNGLNKCLTLDTPDAYSTVSVMNCDGGVDQLWYRSLGTNQIRNQLTHECLTLIDNNDRTYTAPCGGYYSQDRRDEWYSSQFTDIYLESIEGIYSLVYRNNASDTAYAITKPKNILSLMRTMGVSDEAYEEVVTNFSSAQLDDLESSLIEYYQSKGRSYNGDTSVGAIELAQEDPDKVMVSEKVEVNGPSGYSEFVDEEWEVEVRVGLSMFEISDDGSNLSAEITASEAVAQASFDNGIVIDVGYTVANAEGTYGDEDGTNISVGVGAGIGVTYGFSKNENDQFVLTFGIKLVTIKIRVSEEDWSAATGTSGGGSLGMLINPWHGW